MAGIPRPLRTTPGRPRRLRPLLCHPCIHERSCLRCPLLRPSPAQRHRITEVQQNLIERIAEADREGWAGEAEGLKISLEAARDKLAQLDQMARRANTVHLGMPTFSEIAGRTITGEGVQA
jgi:hypothetical protein